jgi:hypothetical protein
MWEKQPLRKTHRRTSVKFSYALRFIEHVENQKSNPIKSITEQPKSTKTTWENTVEKNRQQWWKSTRTKIKENMFGLPYHSRVVKTPKNLEDITKLHQDNIATTIAAKVIHKGVVIPQLDLDVLQRSCRITVTKHFHI